METGAVNFASSFRLSLGIQSSFLPLVKPLISYCPTHSASVFTLEEYSNKLLLLRLIPTAALGFGLAELIYE